MKAVEIQNQSLVLTQRDVPSPAKGEILIKVKAAGVNRPDILQRNGLYPPPEGITDIPGLEVSGIVEKASGNYKKGDEVCALLAGGGYAEYAVVPEGQVLPKLKKLSFAEAAALPECIFTVWNNLFERGGLKSGDNVLIHGGTSGIGSFAIQMALAFGANIYTTVGNDEKKEFCEELGARTVNYKNEDFEEAFADIKMDVVLDMVGGDYLQKNINLMNDEGRHVSIAFLNGRKANVNIQQIMKKRLILTGSTLRNRPIAEKQSLRDQILQKIWPLIEKGEIAPVMDKTYPIETAWKSHVRMESGKHIGKIVLEVS